MVKVLSSSSKVENRPHQNVNYLESVNQGKNVEDLIINTIRDQN